MCNSRKIITASVVVLTLLWGTLVFGEHQEGDTRLAHSDGKGTIRVGREEFKISSAVVKLLPDYKAEITLVSEITIFVGATWSNHATSQHEFELQITRDASGSTLEGTGKLFLSDDSKSVKRLTLKCVSRTTKRPVEVNLEGK